MKTYVTYGFGWALAGAILTLALYFLGFHSSAEKLSTGQMIGLVGGVAVAVTFIVLATKARRAETPASEAFGYGSALGAAMMTGVFATIFGLVFYLLYIGFINPGFQEIQIQAQIAKWEQAGMSSSQIEGAEKMMRRMMSPIFQGAIYLIGGLFFTLIIGLITSAFLKRPAAPLAVVEPPPVAN